jgi:hypothetical protein
VKGLKPGAYEVQAVLPDYSYKDEYSSVRKLVVHDRGCAQTNFSAIPNGHISGRIVDSNGHPVKKAVVVLIRADAEGRVSMGDEVAVDYVDNEQGRFEMGKISPGEYLLGLSITSSPDAEEPYPTTYYPGVRDRSQATLLRIGLAEKLPDLVLSLPAKLRERTVQGVVVWPDGSPAAGAEVHLSDQDHPELIANGTVEVDASGRFKLIGYEGIRYWVLASTYDSKECMPSRHSSKQKATSRG